MAGQQRRRKLSRADYERGLYGYHDPTAGVGGASPTRSALTARLWLAGFGLLCCTIGALVAFRLGLTWFAIMLVALAAIAAVDFAWVAHRKRRGEPG